MKILQKTLKLSKVPYYTRHLTIMNAVLDLDLTSKEIDVIASFMSLGKEMTSTSVFNTEARKRVMKSLKISTGGLSNYVRALTGKGFFTLGEDKKPLGISSNLYPEESLQGYKLKLVLDEA